MKSYIQLFRALKKVENLIIESYMKILYSIFYILHDFPGIHFEPGEKVRKRLKLRRFFAVNSPLRRRLRNGSRTMWSCKWFLGSWWFM